ncbi:hypothetical protein Y1Q_0011488 [Alligator mississippiensis]|uniref:Uncharacterized protein n=1 Tax=Alligator mississippiensis TaxID=8496 RepID=A0A151LZZ1_ALLMI|nr:hypothetical protein Y1Q_0011488 [Alligator mississippiensis]
MVSSSAAAVAYHVVPVAACSLLMCTMINSISIAAGNLVILHDIIRISQKRKSWKYEQGCLLFLLDGMMRDVNCVHKNKT